MTEHCQCIKCRLERAERALNRAGWTYLEGAAEWKPPLGPSAAPLLDKINSLAGPLIELIIAYQDADSPEIQDTLRRGRAAILQAAH